MTGPIRLPDEPLSVAAEAIKIAKEIVDRKSISISRINKIVEKWREESLTEEDISAVASLGSVGERYLVSKEARALSRSLRPFLFQKAIDRYNSTLSPGDRFLGTSRTSLQRSVTINEEKRRDWLFEHVDYLDLYEVFLSAIRVIPFEEFLANLEKAAKLFFAKFPKKDRIALVCKPRDHSQWCVELLKETFVKHEAEPDSILSEYEMVKRGYIPPEVDTLVVVDDAIGSGMEMNDKIEFLRSKFPNAKIVVVVAYATSFGIDKLKSLPGVTIYFGEKLSTIEEFIEKTVEKESIKDAVELFNTTFFFDDLNEFERGVESRTLSILPHRVLDDDSFPKAVRQGEILEMVINHSKRRRIVAPPEKFIEEVVPPYAKK